MFVPIKQPNNGGYIALTTSILLSISLLLMVTAVSFQGFASRFTILESELKEESIFLAEACVQTAILKYAQDDSYTGDESVTIGTDSCYVVAVDDTPVSATTIEVTASSSDAFTNLAVTVDMTDPVNFDITAWEEVASF